MTNYDNQYQPNRIYDKSLRQWIEVPADYFKEFDRERTALRKRMQDHGRCVCPRDCWWLCDINCCDCEFCRAGDMLALEAPNTKDGVTFADSLESPDEPMEKVAEDRDTLNRLIKRLRELDPDADRILQIWRDHPDGISDRKVAEALSIPQRTFADRMKRIRTELRKIRGY